MHAAGIVAAYKAAAGDNKAQQAAVYSGLLNVACANGATADNVRAVGADIRRMVTAAMRQAAGLPAQKATGEKGAPDFSTASVYAKLLADSMELQNGPHGTDYALAVEKAAGANPALIVDSAHDIPLQFMATKSAQSRVNQAVADSLATEFDRMARDLLGYDAEMSATDRIAQLESAVSSQRQRITELTAAGDPGASLTIARAERDAARAATLKADDAARAASLQIDKLRAELAATQAAVTGAPAVAIELVRADRDALAAERDALAAELAAARQAISERDALAAERDATIARQRAQLLAGAAAE